MSGSTLGKAFNITTFGESHGKGIGVVVQGCPSGLAISEEIIQKALDRRKPGTGITSTKRSESDRAIIVSGIFNGKTTGTPIMIFIKNKDTKSKSYDDIATLFRPGHGDYTYQAKYGIRDSLAHSWNWQKNLIEDVIANEDAIRTGEDTEYVYYITNLDQARRDYRGVELQLKKRLSNNYQFLLVYTLSEAKGSLANSGQSEGLNVYGDFQEVIEKRYGILPWDDTHYLKLNGSYHMPWGIVLGTSIGWRSGRPYNRISANLPPTADNFSGYTSQFYLEERGSYRLGHVWWMDLRAAKDFNIGDTELQVILDFFNVWNNQFVLARQSSDSLNENSTWSNATAWMGAGNLVVGLRFSF